MTLTRALLIRFDNNRSFYFGGLLFLELTLAKSTYPPRQ